MSGNVTMFKPTRAIFYYDDVDQYGISKLINFLYILDCDTPDDKPLPIELHICSHGGAIEDCLEGVTFIRKWVHCPVITICHGYAESAGFYLFMAGDKRYADANAVLMFHYCSMGIEGGTKLVKDEAAEAENEENRLIGNLLLDTKLTDEVLKKNASEHNWYITPREMKKYKLCQIV